MPVTYKIDIPVIKINMATWAKNKNQETQYSIKYYVDGSEFLFDFYYLILEEKSTWSSNGHMYKVIVKMVGYLIMHILVTAS